MLRRACAFCAGFIAGELPAEARACQFEPKPLPPSPPPRLLVLATHSAAREFSNDAEPLEAATAHDAPTSASALHDNMGGAGTLPSDKSSRGRSEASLRRGAGADGLPSAIENLLRLLAATNQSELVSSANHARRTKLQAGKGRTKVAAVEAPVEPQQAESAADGLMGRPVGEAFQQQPRAGVVLAPERAEAVATESAGVSSVLRTAAVVIGCLGYLAVGAVLSVLVFVYNVWVDQHSTPSCNLQVSRHSSHGGTGT